MFIRELGQLRVTRLGGQQLAVQKELTQAVQHLIGSGIPVVAQRTPPYQSRIDRVHAIEEQHQPPERSLTIHLYVRLT